MSDFLINNRIGSEKQYLFLGTERVIGVQSISVNPNFSLSPINHLGSSSRDISYIPSQEQSAYLSINAFLLDQDFFVSHVTGGEPVNAYIMRSPTDFDTIYSLTSGQFINYICDYSIGNVPSITTTFVSYGEVGGIPTGGLDSNQLEYIAAQSYDVTGVLVPYGNSVTINIDDFNTNRVQSFSVSLDMPKTPIYKMGSKKPYRWDIGEPLRVQCSFSFEQGDYVGTSLRATPQNSGTKNISLIVKDYNTDTVITSYSFDNMNLLSEESSVRVNDDVIINQNYEGIFYPDLGEA